MMSEDFSEDIIKGYIETAIRIADLVNLNLKFTHDGEQWEIVTSLIGIRNPQGYHSEAWNTQDGFLFGEAMKSGIKDSLLSSIKNIKHRLFVSKELYFIDDRLELLVDFLDHPPDLS